jgi:hypothetical protein
MRTRAVIGVLAAAALAGCGHAASPATPGARPLAVGPAYAVGAAGRAVATGRPVGRLRCSTTPVRRYGVHVELFVDGLAVRLPAGIGIAPPLRRAGVYVRGGRCRYPLSTREPTGVVEVAADGAAYRLADLFAVWGQPLTPGRVARFARAGGVRAFLAGRPAADPRAIRLVRHAQIVLELGVPRVPPHARYRFPEDL